MSEQLVAGESAVVELEEFDIGDVEVGDRAIGSRVGYGAGSGGAGLVMSRCDIHAMAEHLKVIGAEVAPGAHAVLLLDQAGWRVSKRLPVSDNVTPVPISRRSPELNPVENLWQFLRDNWLSNHVFISHDDIVAHYRDSWNKIMD